MYISEGGNRLEQSSNGHDGDDEGMKSIKNMKKRKKEREKWIHENFQFFTGKMKIFKREFSIVYSSFKHESSLML